MAFQTKDLSVLAYANGFTLWHYTTADPAVALTKAGPGYFDPANAMLRAGDIVYDVAGACYDLDPETGKLSNPVLTK